MASAADVHSILHKGAADKPFQPRFDPTKKVKRYFPGKVPDFEAQVPSDEESSTTRRETISHFGTEPDVSEDSENEDHVFEEARPVKRQRREVVERVEAPIEEEIGEEKKKELNKDVEEEEEISLLRERLKQRAIERREEEAKAALEQNASLQAEAFESEEESSEEEEEDESLLQGMKPVFIPAAMRESLKEQKEIEAQEEMETKRKVLLASQRKEDSKKLLLDMVRQEEEDEKRRLEQPESGEPEDMPEDNDDDNEEAEYELWKIRELKRIRRDHEESDERKKFLVDLERRRGMTDEERQEDDRRLDALAGPSAEKGKYTFLQKYYHKGVFFQDLAKSGAEPIYLRDFNKAVGDDSIDKKTLPKPMQVRRGLFGKAGQVKHTHLADVDTTDFSSAWTHNSQRGQVKGANQLDRPSVKPKNQK